MPTELDKHLARELRKVLTPIGENQSLMSLVYLACDEVRQSRAKVVWLEEQLIGKISGGTTEA